MTGLKILHVVRGMMNSSGTTHIVKPLAEEQARQGQDVSVWFCEQGGQTPVLPDPELVQTRCFKTSLPLYHPGVSFPLSAALKQQMPTFDFVHIHAVWNYPTWRTMRTASKLGVQFMVAPQGSMEPWAMAWHGGRKALYARHVELPLMNRAFAMQALTAKEEQQIRSAGVTAPCRIIPNGVDLSWFDRKGRSLARRLDLPHDARTVLSLSRLDPKKGIDILIRGFARFAQTNRNVWLIIAGQDGGSGYRRELEKVAAQSGAARRIRFIGEVRGEEKYKTLLGADAFALISHSEGLPVASVEAMASRLPVILTPGCNVPEVAVWDAGKVVSPTLEETAQALSEIFANPERARQLGERARKLVEEKFTWQRIAQKTIEVYQQAQEPGAT